MVTMLGSLATEKRWRKGPWTHEEDKLLSEYVSLHGEGRWSSVAKITGLNRSGKSSRLRWVNYLRPGLKKGQLTPLEEGIIIELHAVLGNKWSAIARYLPGRTDNEIKNYWRTHFGKREKAKRNKKVERQRAKVQKQMKQEQPQLQEQQPQEETKNNETKSCETTQLEKEQQVMMGFMYPTIEHQYSLSLPSMHQEFSSSTWPDTTADDGGLSWFSLWDFDEPHHDVNQFSKNNNVVPNQGTFGGGGGDSMQNQDITSLFVGAYDNICYGKYTFG